MPPVGAHAHAAGLGGPVPLAGAGAQQLSLALAGVGGAGASGHAEQQASSLSGDTKHVGVRQVSLDKLDLVVTGCGLHD